MGRCACSAVILACHAGCHFRILAGVASTTRQVTMVPMAIRTMASWIGCWKSLQPSALNPMRCPEIGRIKFISLVILSPVAMADGQPARKMAKVHNYGSAAHATSTSITLLSCAHAALVLSCLACQKQACGAHPNLSRAASSGSHRAWH